MLHLLTHHSAMRSVGHSFSACSHWPNQTKLMPYLFQGYWMSPSEELSPPNDNIHGGLNPQSIAKKISSEKALPRRSVTFLELLLETNDDCWGSWMDEKAEHLLYGSMNQGYMMQCQKWLFPHWNGRTKDWVLSPCGHVFGEIRRTFTVAETVDENSRLTPNVPALIFLSSYAGNGRGLLTAEQ